MILEHVEVIDGTGAAPLADRNVRISAGKIAAIMPGADELPRDGATILDLRGRSVLPGIVGMHDHLFYLAQPDLRPDGSLERPAFFVETRFSAPRLYLANGVTTIRTAGAVEPETELGVQDRIGSIAVGKIADLVVVKGDPAARIADVENVENVFKDGAGYDPKKLLDSVKGRYGEY